MNNETYRHLPNKAVQLAVSLNHGEVTMEHILAVHFTKDRRLGSDLMRHVVQHNTKTRSVPRPKGIDPKPSASFKELSFLLSRGHPLVDSVVTACPNEEGARLLKKHGILCEMY